MNKAMSVFVILLVGLSSFANNSNTFKKFIFENVRVEEPQNIHLIEFKKIRDIKTNNFSFETPEQFQNFEVDIIDCCLKFDDDIECSVSITVKIRVAMGTYIEASATLSEISCDDLVSKVKVLRALLIAGFQ